MALSNSQYDAIMRIYSSRQLEDRHQQERRCREVYEKVPQVRMIEDEIGAQAVAGARKLLDGDPDAVEELKRRIRDLREQKAVLLASAGFPPDYMEMRYHCPDCRDTGYIDGKKCRCFKKEEIRLLYAQSNIEEVLKRENFAAFSFDVYDKETVIPEIQMTAAEYMKQVYRWCREYAENFRQKGGSLIFTGGTGVGKTFLSNCIAKELIDQFQSVIYLSSNDLFDVFSKNRFQHETEEEMREMYQYILDCDLLIIDDLGTELNNTFVSSQLFYCINERMIRQKSVIISTNLSPAMLRDSYSDRIASRILSSYMVIPLYGEDIRAKIR